MVEVDGGHAVGEAPAPIKAVRWAKKVARLILAQWLLIGFGVACVVGYYFPGELARLR